MASQSASLASPVEQTAVLASFSGGTQVARSKRRIKIEEAGDYSRKRTHPVVRLKGRWLQAAGFPPGRHIELTVIEPGLIELRVIEAVEPHLKSVRDQSLA